MHLLVACRVLGRDEANLVRVSEVDAGPHRMTAGFKFLICSVEGVPMIVISDLICGERACIAGCASIAWA